MTNIVLDKYSAPANIVQLRPDKKTLSDKAEILLAWFRAFHYATSFISRSVVYQDFCLSHVCFLERQIETLEHEIEAKLAAPAELSQVKSALKKLEQCFALIKRSASNSGERELNRNFCSIIVNLNELVAAFEHHNFKQATAGEQEPQKNLTE